MIHMQMYLPQVVTVACSGGVDSVAVAAFLKKGGRHVQLLYVVHQGDDNANVETQMVRHVARKIGVEVQIATGVVQNQYDGREANWSNARNTVFQNWKTPVITGHHLDDQVETWVWSSLNGRSFTMRPRNGNVFRPFMLNKKQELVDFVEKHGIPYYQDPTNSDPHFAVRNRVRNELLPVCRLVNPGLDKVVARHVRERYAEYAADNQPARDQEIDMGMA